ncbi:MULTISPECIES: TetR/AcrR family transcriptional regulator [unclassified Sphingobium]|uniref:TetR/AcrR family transcriptional regulator n=1 Tax=unclassified Sphingobium TaxID=2611147 RepID=UPI000D165875|nr:MULTISPECIES: TetR/AcrR family transcriptional regulator [unclassified Sphingobium]MBG6120441.1 AcrR family transcriptional regulator [Sphingobium sp. JAI105]PSO10036.1 TetR/AcrR family transcriptional regulator [Sphingobium sp. AEW4]TWC98933.1 TetR family transcriptional regulator [Sphingobium sp. AEW010]TWD18412.1 TetR family transcriptional regulator [Sphingobium sp. AEW013]TWD21040.1 TetR family transcriptional regulator [Sphingobium sp. AEW001]
MARTQAPDYDQRREFFVAKAAQLFAKSGFSRTSISELAKACDTSKSLLYHYYQSKEEILHAVMASHINLLEQDVAEILSEGGNPRDLLRSIVHRFMRHYTGAVASQKVLLNELDNLPEDKRSTIVAQQRGIVEAVGGLLQDIFIDLKNDPARAWASAMLLFGMINWTHTWFDPDGPISPDELADMVINLVLRQTDTVAS